MIEQFMASLSPNNRPQQQSSPSDQSMSTSTPPHQTVSRASPASTALVMSSNNINHHHQQQPELPPPHQHHHHSHSHGHQSQHQPSSRHMLQANHLPIPQVANRTCLQAPNPNGTHARPNPMVRQFGCHAKSMSAGVVVTVPGVSSNLATINGQNGHHPSSHNHSNHSNHHASNMMSNGNSHSHQSVHNSANIITHSKLASSNYLPDSYHLFHSITDMSCDNFSNVSQLIAEGQPSGPAPSYYHIHPKTSSSGPNRGNRGNANSNPISGPNGAGSSGGPTSASSCSSTIKRQPEFLPICDLLFNLISMIIYFCGNTFNIISLIALYYHPGMYNWALIGSAFVIASNITCQYTSYRWLYQMKLKECRRKQDAEKELEQEEGCERSRFYRPADLSPDFPCSSCAWLPNRATELRLKFLFSVAIDAVTHMLCLGFLVRYIKLVIPVDDTARVKHEARDLSLIRMVHGFVQSAPLLLLQAYLIYSPQTFQSSPITNLIVTSAILSLINVSWALASFTKYVREKHMNKFVLTWLGIFSQLLWRLGTISSRVVALTIYAVYYGYWMLVVLALHWLTMFFWLIKPGNLLRDEVGVAPTKKVSLAGAIAWIYCFCYINLEEQSSKLKTTSFYLIMFLENNLLLTVCLIFSPQVNSFKYLSMLVVYMGFVVGMLFMFLYYKYFHVNVLNNGLSCSQESVDSIADQLSPAGKKIAGFKPGTLRLKSEDVISQPGQRYHSNISVNLNSHTGSHPEIGSRSHKPPYLTHSQAPMPQSGVFNCKISTGYGKPKLPNSHVRHPC